jgi:hypothetical protein
MCSYQSASEILSPLPVLREVNVGHAFDAARISLLLHQTAKRSFGITIASGGRALALAESDLNKKMRVVHPPSNRRYLRKGDKTIQ